MSDADDTRTLGWENILTAIAAAAGSAAWVSAVGSGVMGARLENAGMPVQSVLALMPPEQRFAIGVNHLLAPLFVGLVGFLADWVLTSRRKAPDHPTGPGDWRSRLTKDVFNVKRFRRSPRRRLAAATIVVGALLGLLLLEPPSLWLYLLQIAAIVVALVGVYVFGSAQGTGTTERGIVFVLVLVLAGVIAFAFERVAGDRFDFAAVRFKEASAAPIAGYYVTTTADALLLVTLGDEDDPERCPPDRGLARITAVPDDQIERVWIGPRDVEFGLARYCAQKAVALRSIVPPLSAASAP